MNLRLDFSYTPAQLKVFDEKIHVLLLLQKAGDLDLQEDVLNM
ncbi:hypothetical protein [Campylobacter sp. LH-2024]